MKEVKIAHNEGGRTITITSDEKTFSQIYGKLSKVDKTVQSNAKAKSTNSITVSDSYSEAIYEVAVKIVKEEERNGNVTQYAQNFLDETFNVLKIKHGEEYAIKTVKRIIDQEAIEQKAKEEKKKPSDDLSPH